MFLYVGDTRSRALLGQMRELDVGQLHQRGSIRPRLEAARDHVPCTPRALHARWAYDNGAFSDFLAGRSFDGDAFQRDLDRIVSLSWPFRPFFVVLPDVVGDGRRSLDLSLAWLDRLRGVRELSLYLAIQEGIELADVAPIERWLSGIFIGGKTWSWKVRAAAHWTPWARERGLFVHVGRAGSVRRIETCHALGVSSVDSNAPLWSKACWKRVTTAIRSQQRSLFPLQPEALRARATDGHYFSTRDPGA